jgi:Protein of unknown function (DUF4199)
MKKTVLIFGLISGAMMAVFMFATLPFLDKIGYGKSLYIGYASMVLAFIMVFFGIRSYRENVGGGTVTFGRAFVVGILITVIASVCYVIAWEILYYNFIPDFVDKYTVYISDKMKSSGASAEAIQAKVQEMRSLKELLNNPFLSGVMIFIEPFPVGLIITLISSLILRTKKKAQPA